VAGPRFVYDLACPGKAFWRLLTEEFDLAAAVGRASGARFDEFRTRFTAELFQIAEYHPSVRVNASPFVTAQIARVAGKPHVFLSNFKGLRSKESATPVPEANVTITFPSTPGARVRILPFLGDVEDLKSDYANGETTCRIAELGRAAVVWVE
jgi:hypothetical protein